jgi:predicted membrane chloride channel (bestrophin family)
VFLVISYSLMGLEMMAVTVEDPFGHEESDLRISNFNTEIADMLQGSYRRWQKSMTEENRTPGLYSQRFSQPRFSGRYSHW